MLERFSLLWRPTRGWTWGILHIDMAYEIYWSHLGFVGPQALVGGRSLLVAPAGSQISCALSIESIPQIAVVWTPNR